ncbi:protein mono-ADP-ribosyltransferase PARP12 isoform X2 [Nematostella vectensis]|uniref:protein mono-ADP-ribosyltransferase PARP12 isoform X2 n=1 Tax=Nematostella vectensis TaxID=45351 RepID=UPI0020779012|nr:protein mono-ADP-ribosyltransferase PARP12 isoform X2 [Nematostella vectensis]
MDRRPRTYGKKALELFSVICKNGGEIELGFAVSRLRPQTRQYLKQIGALKFVRNQGDLFKVTTQDQGRVLIEVCLSLKFCPKAKERQGCKDLNCGMLHVCPYYIKGKCAHGQKCRLSHKIQSSSLQNFFPVSIEGYDNETLIKLMQKAVDDTESERAAANNPIPDICKFYNNALGCSKKDKCPFLHVCQHFVDGKCKFGDTCKRVHHFKEQHNLEVLSNHQLERFDLPMILHILSGRERKRSTSSSSDTSDTTASTPRKSRANGVAPIPKSPNGAATSNSSSAAPCIKNKEDAEICGFYLRGCCNYGNNCMNHHTKLPYLWQWRGTGGSWESLPSDMNVMVERSYCQLSEGEQYPISIDGEMYSIVYKDMTAVPRHPDVPKLELRRLSTASSVEAPPGHVYSTRWVWYWMDENGKWQSYDSPENGKAPSTTCSKALEKGFLAGEGTHDFSAGMFKYTLHFDKLYQKNNTTGNKRPVRRIPEFVAENDMKEIAKRRKAAAAAAAAASESSSGGPSSTVLPKHWDPIPDDKDFICVQLSSTSPEYKKIEAQFLSSLDTSRRIVKIERIQNPDLWMQFAQKKERMEKKSKCIPEERSLFHGTASDIVTAICQQGFDWRLCGKHGTAYGKGSYFASTAAYSHRYSSSNSLYSNRASQQMFVAKVLVGSYTVGSSSYTRPPAKDPAKPHGELYDSCVNDEQNPGIFVVFDNSQVYPEFLISYL